MDLNYIILAHNEPLQLKRLILSLSEPATFFYVHIDKKTALQPFADALQDIPNVTLLEGDQREDCIWGDMSLVKATLTAARLAIAQRRKGYITLLSGQDYPIKSRKRIRKYLEDNYGVAFIEAVPLPTDTWSNHGLDRIAMYKKNLSGKRGDYIILPTIFQKEFYTKATLKSINRLIRKGDTSFIRQVLKKRRIPSSMQLYGGSAWWSITTEDVIAIINFADQNPGVMKYFADCLLPDEIFFQSILMHVHKGKIALRPTLTYANWTRKNCPLPVTFTDADYDEIASQSDKLFARKFMPGVSNKILDLIDERIMLTGA